MYKRIGIAIKHKCNHKTQMWKFFDQGQNNWEKVLQALVPWVHKSTEEFNFVPIHKHLRKIKDLWWFYSIKKLFGNKEDML